AQLEHGKFAAAFSSGMAAITAVVRLLEPGDEVIAGDELYGGTIRLLERAGAAYGFGDRYVDTTDADGVAAAVTKKTRLILIETPSNPTLRITDLKDVTKLSAGRDIIFAVDNSKLSPTLKNPPEVGAYLVIHSATKYLCGHSDV